MTNEKIFSDVKNFALIFVPINWAIGLIVTLILFLIFGSEVAFGYALGSLTALLTFGLLMKNTTSTLLPGKVSVRSKIFGNNIARLIISGFILCIAFYHPNFNFYSTIAGLLVLKLVLIGFVLVRYKFFKDKEEIVDDTTV